MLAKTYYIAVRIAVSNLDKYACYFVFLDKRIVMLGAYKVFDWCDDLAKGRIVPPLFMDLK